MSSFRELSKSIQEKKAISTKLISENPNYVPLEIYRSKTCTLNCFEKKNLLVPCSFPFYLVVEDIRQRVCNLEANQSLFCFVKKRCLVKPGMTVGEIYNKYKESDGFLYIEVSDVNAYG